MTTDNLQQRIEAALRTVHSPRAGADVVTAELVRDVATTVDGRVRLTLLLAPADDATLVRDVRQAVQAVRGVADVRVDVQDASRAAASSGTSGMSGTPGAPGAPAGPRTARVLPTLGQERPAPARVAAPVPKNYPGLGRVLAVSSGKGGVGKSTVAVNLAVALARSGHRVGLMDADVYGPNVPRMMGLAAPLLVGKESGKITPLEAYGVRVVSLGFMIERDQPAIWRGPIVMKIITQFLADVEWGQLDYLIVDMPPGTGDAQLSLVQATAVHGALIVTTPQEVSVGDALKGVKMFERVGVPVLGIVENMSWFECPHCGKPTSIFGSGGGERLAREVGLPLLGQVPLYPRIHEGGDDGRPIVAAEPDAPAAKALAALAVSVVGALGAVSAR